MSLAEKIMAWLEANPGGGHSVAEIAEVILDVDASDIRRACDHLRAEGKVGRNGIGTATSPYRFYSKARGP